MRILGVVLSFRGVGVSWCVYTIEKELGLALFY